LRVTDDGRGFDVETTIPAGHYGLDIMGERAAEIGASLKVESKPGDGTEVVVTWPKQGEENAND
jgi:nitrate/nitrite-specific signal transduction histidine kinase